MKRKIIDKKIPGQSASAEYFSRNIGVLRTQEQKILSQSSVAIAGVGGVGGLLAERLTRIGIGEVRISDPGTFEKSNFNRQFGSGIRSDGKKKVQIIKKELLNINPSIRVMSDSKGIWRQKDADDFVEGASIIVDAMDYGLFKQSIYLQKAARARNLYYLFTGAIGFGAIITIFKPDGCTLEEYNGLPKDVDLDTLPKIILESDNVCSTFPSYLFYALTKKQSSKMIRGEIPVSTNSIGVGLSSIASANEVVNLLLKRKPAITAPDYIHIDLLERKYLIHGKPLNP
jgi:molybdopterin/thiamine biosynthesis adenylyltransferase